MMIEPFAAFRAACLAVAAGEAEEIELEWRDASEDRIDQPGTETTLVIAVRRRVKHLHVGGPLTGEETTGD